jgi:DNA-binding transcriptional MerR regulator
VSRHTPAETAAKTGFSLDTLRYYEKIGLLSDIGRTSAGVRVFSDDDLDWLGVLRCLRDTGMPIAAMQDYAGMCRRDDDLGQRVAILEEHEHAVRAKIAELTGQLTHLQEKIAWYQRRLSDDDGAE